MDKSFIDNYLQNFFLVKGKKYERFLTGMFYVVFNHYRYLYLLKIEMDSFYYS
jgi:hypothetical protein